MKCGKFIGKRNLTISEDQKNEFLKMLIKAVIQNEYSETVKFSDLVVDKLEPNGPLNVSVNILNYNKKKQSFNRNDVTILGLDKLSFLLFFEDGYHEETGEKMTSFSLMAWTNGRVHQYRRHHSHDFKYEGVGHYMYDTELSELESSISSWYKSVMLGRV